MRVKIKQIDDASLSTLKVLLNHIKDEYDLSYNEIIGQVAPDKKESKEEDGIPISVFNPTLGALESIVKYLVEEKQFSHKEISTLLNRDPRTIWSTYNKAGSKLKQKLDTGSQLKVPFSVFTPRKHSILESLVIYLKTELDMFLHEISVILCRDDSTIWTAFNRAKKKDEN